MPVKHIEKFKKIAEKIALKNKKDLNELTREGNELLREYREKGCLKKLPLEALNVDYYSLIPLLDYLTEKSATENEVISPVAGNPDSSWMAASSFCFINIRGTGKSKDTHGDFINAAKLLPILRVNGIHLAPFFECALEIVYGIDSLDIIDENALNPDFLKAGMKADEQVRFFTDFAHLLGMTVGFDIEPHTSQFSRIAIENPHLFRWLKLSDDRKTLYGNMKQTEMLKEKNQAKIRDEVVKIRNEVLSEYKLRSLEQKGKDKITKPAHYEAINRLISAGLWTLPSHTWKGAGLPEFSHYERKDGYEYPEFKYLCNEGKNHRDHAFGTLTPFRFYDEVPLNKTPKLTNPPVINNDAVKYFSGIFPRLYKKFRFDFLRFDYVDHVFDSILDKSGLTPVSDRLTPYILKKTITRARSGGKKFIGAMAERMGTDINLYKKVGFDLTLGTDVLSPIGVNLIKDTVKINKKIDRMNARAKKKSNIQFAIDSHDTGHPLFNLTPMINYGAKGVALRQFISRFCGWGNAVRAKYEVIGNQDGTTGLYSANNNIESLEWKSDSGMNAMYHNIEDLFDEFLPILKAASFVKLSTFKGKVAYWVLQSGHKKIIDVVNTSSKSAVKNIELKTGFDIKTARITDPYSAKSETLPGNVIDIIPALECRLIVV